MCCKVYLSSDNKNGFFGSYVFLIVIYAHPKGRLKINIEHSIRKGGISCFPENICNK